MARRSRVYIAGPITNTPDYKENFEAAAKLLNRNGYSPVSPLLVEPRCDKKCTEEEDAYNEEDHTWACYLRYDIIAMLDCDEVYFLRGWEESRGAQLEMTVASNCGLVLRYQEEEER